MDESTPDDDEAERYDELAGECCVKRQYGEAAEHYRRALTLREEKYGPDSVPVADSLCRLSGVLLSVPESRAEAECHTVRAVAIYERVLSELPEGDRHRRHLAYSLIGTLTNLAGAASRRGDHHAAEALYRRSQGHIDHTFGVRPMLLPHLPPFAETLIRSGHTSEAEERLRFALRAEPQPDTFDVVTFPDCQCLLASICLADGRTTEAEALYRDALERIERHVREQWGPARALEGLARVCRLTGRGDEADQLEGRAAELRASAKR